MDNGTDDDEHRLKMQILKAEQDQKVRERQTQRGIVIVHDGDGKGKSTAAFGMAFRAAGHGQRVGIVQFIKGSWKTGEESAFKRFPEIELLVAGDGFTWDTQDRERDTASAMRGLDVAKRMVEAARSDEPEYQLVILDELNVAISYGYVPAKPVVEMLQNKPSLLNIVITGRGATKDVIDVADTVTRMECIKHAFDTGIRAQRGIDF